MNKNVFLFGLGGLAAVGVGVIALALRPQTGSTSGEEKLVTYQQNGFSQTLRLRFVGNTAIEGARYTFGSSSAKNTVVEFADYQCPACGVFAREFESSFVTKFVDAGKVRYAFRDFPLPQHQNAPLAARAAACANSQDGFEKVKAMLFRAQDQWSEQSPAIAKQQFLEISGYANLDKRQFASCLEQPTNDAAVNTDLELGRKIGLEATPSFVINGYLVSGALPPEAFEAVLKEVGN